MTWQDSCDILILLTSSLYLSACRGELPPQFARGARRRYRYGGTRSRSRKRKRAAPEQTDAQKIERKNISSQPAGCSIFFVSCSKKERADFHQLVLGGGRWICLPAGRPFCGSDTPLAYHSLPLPFESTMCKKKTVTPDGVTAFLVGEGGFEPPKSLTTDLQSAPFGHSGIPPYEIVCLSVELVDGFEPPTC